MTQHMRKHEESPTMFVRHRHTLPTLAGLGESEGLGVLVELVFQDVPHDGRIINEEQVGPRKPTEAQLFGDWNALT